MGNDSWWKRGASKNKTPRADGIPDTIKDWELNKGGWRYDDHNTGYSLTWEQLLEYEKTNIATKDDDEFYDWFKKFRTEQGITSRSYVGKSYTSSWDDYDDAEETTGGKKKWLSSWWASGVYKSFSGSSADASRLAVVLQAVRTTIRAVDDSNPPMSVEWATEDDVSATMFDANKIVINPEPVRSKKYDDGQAVDITTGFALHEAGHSKHTRDPYKQILNPEPLRPMQVAGWLLNFVEDVRIERLVAEEYPGFSGYFTESLNWAWERSKANVPTKWGPKLGDKVRAAFFILRFTEAIPLMTDASLKPEIVWWTDWRERYMANKMNARKAIQEALDHLAEDEDTKAEMEAMAKGEAEMEKKMGDLMEALKEAMKGFAEKNLKGLQKCLDEMMKGDGIDEATANEVSKMVRDKLQIEKTIIKTQDGRGNPPIHVTHPTEDADSKRSYIGKPKPVLHRLKAALVFRQELPRYTNRLLKSGRLDDEELWRWADKDYRVFNEEVIAARPQTQLTFLVDLSGSMYGTKLKVAQELAQLFVWALKEMEGVDTKVFGHTGDNGAIAAEIYRLWEPGESLTRLGLIATLDHGNNYDGHAIAWCTKELMERGQPDEQRIIIVLSDGYPAGSSYGGSQGEAHVRETVAWADRQGVKVIQIAIDPSIDPARQARMFKDFIQYTNLEDVPRQLTRLLAKLV